MAKHSLVVVIYSNEEERRLIAKAVESRYLVNAYGDLGEAVVCMRLNQPAAIVIDDKVRSPDGMSVVPALRHFFRDAPIVLCASPGRWTKGVDARLEKPFLRSRLINILSGLTNKSVEQDWTSMPSPHPATLRNSIDTFNHITELIEVGEPLVYERVIEACTPLVSAVTESQYKPLLGAIHEHDNLTYVHSLRVATLLTLFGHTIGLNDEKMLILATGGLLHDVGKISAIQDLTNEPRKLTDDEMVIVRQHVTETVDYLQRQPDVPKGVLTVAANHHERLDGSGYPNGLRDGQLNDLARMAAIVDVFSALTERRSYRPALPPENVFTLMRTDMQHSLDQRLLGQFRDMLMDASCDGWS